MSRPYYCVCEEIECKCPSPLPIRRYEGRLMVDDPNDNKNSFTSEAREKALKWFTEVWPTRAGIDAEKCIIIPARRHEEDIAALPIDSRFDFAPLELPMNFEPRVEKMALPVAKYTAPPEVTAVFDIPGYDPHAPLYHTAKPSEMMSGMGWPIPGLELWERAERKQWKRERRHRKVHVLGMVCGYTATRNRKGPGQFSRADRNRHRRQDHYLRQLIKEHVRTPSLGLLLDSSCF